MTPALDSAAIIVICVSFAVLATLWTVRMRRARDRKRPSKMVQIPPHTNRNSE